MHHERDEWCLDFAWMRIGNYQLINFVVFVSSVIQQKACGGCYKELEDTLCDLRFIHGKCKVGLAPQLLNDFFTEGILNSCMI